jgi:transmembrane sensor
MIYAEQDRLEAANWFLDIHNVDVPSPEMLQKWMRWMADSEAHRLAFIAVEAAWYAASANANPETDSNRSDGDDEYDGTISIHEWRIRRRGQPSAIDDARSKRVWRRRNWGGFAAAAGVGAITLVALLKWHGLSSGPRSATEFATNTGEHMQVTLADGSQVNLGARSRLLVAYTPTGRDVRLEAGEGFFSVQKDASRPFRVHVLSGVVTAVGTAFDVRTANDRIVVAVAQGTVQVTGSEASSDSKATVSPSNLHSKLRTTDSTRISRGESISFVSGTADQSLVHSSISRIDPEQPARWRDGWLVYRDEPLRDVLADVSRYTNRELRVEDGVPEAPHFTGAVYKDSVLEWLESLPIAFPVTITTDGAHITVGPASGSVLAHTR